MAISKVTVHGVADTAGELEQVFHRMGRDITGFIAEKKGDPFVDAHGGYLRDRDGNIQFALSDLKYTPKLNQIVPDERGEETMRDYVVGHATYTVWYG